MTWISLLKKYFCCDRESKSLADAPVEFIDGEKEPLLTPSLSKNLLEWPQNHTVLGARALSSAEVFSFSEEEIDGPAYCDVLMSYGPGALPPPLDSKPTLILDLDNTLIYSSTKELEKFDHAITINYGGKLQKIWILERPGLQQFLDHISTKYEIILFTAGVQQYGIKAMRAIDVKRRIKYFLDRRFCTPIGKNDKNQTFFSKDIRNLGRELSKTLLVDDRDYSFCFNTKNGILVSNFDGDLTDSCLKQLSRYLDYCCTLADMRDRMPFKF